MRSTDNQVMSAEIMIQNPTPLHVSASAAQIRTSRGAAWVFVFHDITQLKSYETLRADFISNLTHELRTPLSALYGYAETLIQGVDDRETSTRFLGIIERQARRLARLLDDLVSLSDLERGLTPLKIEQLEPSRVLSEAAELMQEQAGRRGLRLEVNCPPGLPKVAGDRDRLHQVMLNLIDNAIKYTPREGRVTVEAREVAESNGAGAKPGVALLGQRIHVGHDRIGGVEQMMLRAAHRVAAVGQQMRRWTPALQRGGDGVESLRAARERASDHVGGNRAERESEHDYDDDPHRRRRSCGGKYYKEYRGRRETDSYRCDQSGGRRSIQALRG